MLGCGYLFTGGMVIPHTLSYPGLFSEYRAAAAPGRKTTAWLYMFWHGGFPIAVMAYAWLKDDAETAASAAAAARAGTAILLGLAVVLASVLALVRCLPPTGRALLPPLMENNRYTVEMIYVNTTIWVLCPAALVVLWRRRPHSVLDVWLMVVMCAWLFDVALSAVFNGGRFDLGFYAGRVYGLMAATFVLLMMQVETAKMYAQLARLLTAEQQERRREIAERRRMFDTSLDLILMVDRKGNFLQVSPSSMAILGYEPDEMIGHSAVEFIYPDDLDNTRRRCAWRGAAAHPQLRDPLHRARTATS